MGKNIVVLSTTCSCCQSIMCILTNSIGAYVLLGRRLVVQFEITKSSSFGLNSCTSNNLHSYMYTLIWYIMSATFYKQEACSACQL